MIRWKKTYQLEVIKRGAPHRHPPPAYLIYRKYVLIHAVFCKTRILIFRIFVFPLTEHGIEDASHSFIHFKNIFHTHTV